MPENTITCDCSNEFGPCEDHADYLVIREGASLHTADELTLLLIDDLRDCGVNLSDAETTEYERLSQVLADEQDPTSGCAWFSDPDDSDWARDLADRIESAADGLWVTHEDGYVIARPHADCPLLDN